MKKISRREFIRVSVVAAAATTAAACAPQATPTPPPQKAEPTAAPKPQATTAPAQQPTQAPKVEPTQAPKAAAPTGKFRESPMLTELVKAGKLPPVDERLPVNPWVVPTIEIIGKYGGRLRRPFSGTGDKWGVGYQIDRGLLWYDKNLVLKPRLCESYEVNDKATEYTFKLRKGTRWSDGTPFTSQEFVWFRRYVLGNTAITPSPSLHWGAKNEKGEIVMMDVEAVDDYTVKLKFVAPKGLFIYRVNRQSPYYPSHFMKQWHIETTPDPKALEELAKKEGVDKWENLFDNRRWYHLTPNLPVINGWKPDNTMNEEIFTMSRNPYFWGVDSEGNQLPYIDQLVHRLSNNPETTKLWMLNGEIDFFTTALRDFTVFKAGEQKGNYRLVMAVQGAHMGMQLNMTVKDDKLREFFRKREVRIAVSHAVDRKKLNDLLYQGMAIPRQYSPISKSPNYYEKLSKAYLDYDPKKANDLLDQAGYKRGADGIRTFKDGTPISWVIESTATPGTPDEDGIIAVTKYLGEVGLKVSIKPVARNLYDEHVRANEIQAGFWGGDRVVVPLADASLFIGTQPDRPWCPAWAMYRNNPKSPVAEEPPKDHWIWKIWEIWDKIEAEANEQKRNDLFRQILDIWAEELPYICFLGEWPVPVLMKNGLRNYVGGYPLDDPTGSIYLLNPEQYTWEDPAKQSQ